MSQVAVERTLGRLLTDSQFRQGFYADPAAACLQESLELTTREIEALLAVDQARLQAFSKALDARIVRAAIGGTHYWSSWASAAHIHERVKGSPGLSSRPKIGRATK